MYDISIFSTFGLDVNFQTKKKCELYVDMIPTTFKDVIRVLWVLEPNEVSGIKEAVINNKNNFDLILTWDSDILNLCSNSKLFLFGTTWIKNFDFTKEKEYCITTLVGAKNKCYGHMLRQSLPETSKLITSIPVHLFNSINSPLSSFPEMKQMMNNLYKNELFYSQFHIVIENVIDNNWFTEKLIDCFQTKTVPIYIGCNNIDKFFDINGMIIVKDLKELVNVCNSLTPNTYLSMKKFIDINYDLSMNYSDFRKNITEVVSNFVNEYI